MAKAKIKTEMKKETFIYWKWKKNNTYTKTYVQEIISTNEGNMLELADSTWWTNHPTRVLEKDIDILITDAAKTS